MKGHVVMDSKPEVVVITGASAGIGRATVRRFAKEGAHIGLLERRRIVTGDHCLGCTAGAGSSCGGAVT